MDTSSPVVMLDDAAHLHINNYGIPSAHHSQISLPSFKHLEPYYLRSQYPLPPCHYSGTSHYAPHTGPQQQQESATPLQIMVAPQWDSPTYHDGAGGSDSEADDIGHHMHHSPPKTKWRKQALICTGNYYTLLVSCPPPLTVLLFLVITCILDLSILR